MRTVTASTREHVRNSIGRISEGVCAAYGAIAECHIKPGYPMTINQEDFCRQVEDAATELVGGSEVRTLDHPIMAAEDFSYVLQQIPGAMAFLGACPTGLDPSDSPMNHSNHVVFDETAMVVGAATYATVAATTLRHNAADGSAGLPSG